MNQFTKAWREQMDAGHTNERKRCAEINHTQVLEQAAFDAAWDAFQGTGIDLLDDSDDQTCRCLHNAIRAYLISVQ